MRQVNCWAGLIVMTSSFLALSLKSPRHINYTQTGAYTQETSYGLMSKVRSSVAGVHPHKRLFLHVTDSFNIAQPGSFFTAKQYKEAGGLHAELKYVMDADLYMRIMNNRARYIKLNAWVSGFRMQSQSKSASQSSNFDLEFQSIKQKYLPWIRNKPEGRILYIGLQLINGNYERLLFDNIFARGKHWRKWCEEKHVFQK